MREKICNAVEQKLRPLAFVYALWLEGADANGGVDEYSDLDLWIDVEDAFLNDAIASVESALRGLGELDFCYVMEHSHPQIRQRTYHISQTSPFLMIDVCWQLHSRDMGNFAFFRFDRMENAKVIFDKSQVVRFTDQKMLPSHAKRQKIAEQCRYRLSQMRRIEKYILRGQYPEAFAQYQHYVVEAIVLLLRLHYTPEHSELNLVHISNHIPVKEQKMLVELLKVASFQEMKAKMQFAQEWGKTLLREAFLRQ